MATSEIPYYSHFNYRGPQSTREDGRMRNIPASVVIPNLPQPTITSDQQMYQQYYRTTPTSMVRRSNPDNNSCHSPGFPVEVSTVPGKEAYLSPKSRPQSYRPPSRPELPKRRSSLREAARSLGTSKVAKRLRRHVRSGFDAEDDEEESTSTSESDHSRAPLCGHKTTHLQSEQPQRSPSVVSDLMNELQSSLAITPHGQSRGSCSSASLSNQTMDSSDSASTRTSFTTSSSRSKRYRSEEVNDADGDDEEDSDRIIKRPCPINSLEPEQPQLFACPFAKHDSRRYSAANLDELHYRGCSQSYLTDLARVKQHLYRVHERPPHHCPTCYEVFKNQAQCIKHVATQSCLASPCPFNEKMSPEQLAAIKKKNRGTDPYVGWYEIYKTLFPGSQPPMSPYAAFTATVDTLESFMDFVVQELPKRLRRQMGFVGPTPDNIQGLLPDILRDIRRDFNPSPQHKPELLHHNGVENNMGNSAEAENPFGLNFHHAVTVGSSNHNQMRVARTSVIDLSPSTVYVYPQVPPGQILSNSVPLQIPFSPQHMQQNIGASYSGQQMHYSIQNQNLMQGMDTGPPTAIWQPDVRESSNGYFDNQPTQIPLPNYLTQIEDDGNWIPTMVTTRINHPMNHQGIQDLMSGLFPGGFANHQN